MIVQNLPVAVQERLYPEGAIGSVRYFLPWTGFRPAQTGVTLLESLITLLVMSVGLLGMAALQFVGSQENASALRQSQATWLAYDMAERMRANLAGVKEGAYDDIDTAAASESDEEEEDEEVETATVSCGVGADCSPSNLASWDAAQWGASLSGLPGGRGTVDDVGSDRLRIRVLWDDDVPDVDSSRTTKGCPSDMSITQTCVEITVQP